ncbi:calcium-binding protein [Desulfobacteraceae bacterium SEEP-SAG9]|nr:calcium-binding protein [Desulfobacteraceae bacterium SEEP-SAG9]
MGKKITTFTEFGGFGKDFLKALRLKISLTLPVVMSLLVIVLMMRVPAAVASSGITERVSVDSSGTPGNDRSYFGSISADGHYVAFVSYASNLVPNDTNDVADVFVHDRQTGSTKRVSVDSNGIQGNEESSENDRMTISAEGRYVAFSSPATNLVPGDTNGATDVFVHDRDTDEDGVFDEAGAISTIRVSVDSSGNQANNWSEAPTISADGRYVAFISLASNLVPNDTNDYTDVFVHDQQTGTTVRISVDSSGNQADHVNGSAIISADGRYVGFQSHATNLIPGDTNDTNDAFIHDRDTDEDGVFDEAGAISTIRVSVDSSGNNTDDDCTAPGPNLISADSRYVAFMSSSSNLVPNDTNDDVDIFVHDRQTGITERISTDSNGNEGNGYSAFPTISPDCRYVSFHSHASNLVPGDTNDVSDVFVHDTGPLDVDNDGIEDSIDTSAGFSDDFDDSTTNGTITDRVDQVVTVIDLPDPNGVRITASGGVTPASVSACGGSAIITLNDGYVISITCGSVEIEVISGPVEISFVADDGTTATTTLNTSNSLIFDPVTFTITASPDNTVDCVVLVDGKEFTIEPGESVEIDSTIVIDGCDSGVLDSDYEGQSISEWIDECAADAKNHGKFVSCVAKLTNKLKKAGIITGKKKGAIQSCAAQADIP